MANDITETKENVVHWPKRLSRPIPLEAMPGAENARLYRELITESHKEERARLQKRHAAAARKWANSSWIMLSIAAAFLALAVMSTTASIRYHKEVAVLNRAIAVPAKHIPEIRGVEWIRLDDGTQFAINVPL